MQEEVEQRIVRVAILQIYEWLRIDVVSNIILLRLRSKIILSISNSFRRFNSPETREGFKGTR